MKIDPTNYTSEEAKQAVQDASEAFTQAAKVLIVTVSDISAAKAFTECEGDPARAMRIMEHGAQILHRLTDGCMGAAAVQALEDAAREASEAHDAPEPEPTPTEEDVVKAAERLLYEAGE